MFAFESRTVIQISSCNRMGIMSVLFTLRSLTQCLTGNGDEHSKFVDWLAKYLEMAALGKEAIVVCIFF